MLNENKRRKEHPCNQRPALQNLRDQLYCLPESSGRDGALNLAVSYPAELLRVARKLVWYDKPEQRMANLKTFLSHLMVNGSSADLAVVERTYPPKKSAECLRVLPPQRLRERAEMA